MIAVPIKLNKQDSAVAPLFGKAKWFAFVSEEGEITIEKNEAKKGSAVVSWLLEKGVDVLLMQKMSKSPYEIIQEEGSITIFYVGKERIELKEALKKYADESLVIVDDSNAHEIIKTK
jgi:predicted Fe-Mo cluster-binding NifX family protein